MFSVGVVGDIDMIGNTRTIDMTFHPRSIRKTTAFYIGPLPGERHAVALNLISRPKTPSIQSARLVTGSLTRFK